MNPFRRTLPVLATVWPLLFAPVLPAQQGSSTFGYARTRGMADLGILPRPIEVAVADIVNYHRHWLPLPRAGEAVALDVRFGAERVATCGKAILQIGMTTAPSGEVTALPPVDLALVVDCSGSMEAAGKLDEVRRGLLALAERLRRDDRVALVTFDDQAQVRCPLRVLGDGQWFRAAVERLAPGSSTNLHGGLMLGLRELGRETSSRGVARRVILLTDGIANRGETDPTAILRDAIGYTDDGVDLTTIGVGAELNADLLDRLARGGRGLFHFVADARDIAKVFVDEVEMLIAPVARRPVLRVELPPDLEFERSYGHAVRRCDDGALEIQLPDMNRGMTSVVLLECRAGEVRPEQSLSVRVGLRARAVDGGVLDLLGHATLRGADFGGDPLVDEEVAKNHTIAVLAQGMHRMAQFAELQRWADADRALCAAIDGARRRLPSCEDPDVGRVLEMAEGHARTLRRYVDRFGDY